MLPKAVWAMPAYGTFNLHASLLPDYRGAAPINWAIMNGETETGVTTFFIDDKIDTGEIILQEKTKIKKDDTAGSLHDKLKVVGATLVMKTVKLIESGPVNTKAQTEQGTHKPAPKIFKETCEIDWGKPMKNIYDLIRGLSPYPTAWTTFTNGDMKIFLKIYVASMEKGNHNLKYGEVLSNNKELKIAVDGGFINLMELQLPGKRKMKTKDILNGLIIEKNARVG
jgi:methionyl-tRNA formyltransferase